MSRDDGRQLEEPNIRIAGFQIWIHGAQLVDSKNYFEGDWLRATVHCGAEGSEVWLRNAILKSSELEKWMISSEEVLRSQEVSSVFECEQEDFSVILHARSNDELEMEVKITPNSRSQQHSYKFEIIQKDLVQLIASCGKVLKQYSIGDKNENTGT